MECHLASFGTKTDRRRNAWRWTTGPCRNQSRWHRQRRLQWYYLSRIIGDGQHFLCSDVAISSPFANAGSASMVQIYRGSKQGLILTPTQVSFFQSCWIAWKMRSCPFQTLQTGALNAFGWSLQGLFDYDNNGYLGRTWTSFHYEQKFIRLVWMIHCRFSCEQYPSGNSRYYSVGPCSRSWWLTLSLFLDRDQCYGCEHDCSIIHRPCRSIVPYTVTKDGSGKRPDLFSLHTLRLVS